MKEIIPIALRDDETAIIDRAVMIIGTVLDRFAKANKETIGFAPQVDLHVTQQRKTEDSAATPATNAQWLIDLTGIGYARGERFEQALGRLCGMTEAKAIRERARLCRSEAEKLERRAAELEKDEAAKGDQP